jgi:hypothetical protein
MVNQKGSPGKVRRGRGHGGSRMQIMVLLIALKMIMVLLLVVPIKAMKLLVARIKATIHAGRIKRIAKMIAKTIPKTGSLRERKVAVRTVRITAKTVNTKVAKMKAK